LFAEQGYGATTVRDIAEAAGVTERTFFRYFTGKEELIIEDALSWLPVLLDKLRHRPDDEDVGTALRRAIQDVGTLLSASPRPTPLWLFSDGPPGTRISKMPDRHPAEDRGGPGRRDPGTPGAHRREQPA
jgi:AcrR family transcriptional regulator